MGQATGLKNQDTDDTFNLTFDKLKVIIVGSSRVMGLDAEYMDEIIATSGKKAEVFNRGLSSDTPSRRMTVLDQSISDKPDVALIGIDYANYHENTDSSPVLATKSKFKNCESKLPAIQDTYSLFTIPENPIFDSANLNPKLSTLKFITQLTNQNTDKEAKAVNPAIKELFDKSMESWNAGKIDEAIEHNNKILELDSNYYDAILNNGFFLQSIGKLDDATYFVNKAVSMSPDSIRANYNKQTLLEKQGKIAESQIIADKIKQIEQNAIAKDLPDDFEASKVSLTGKQSWRFDEPSWRIVQSDQWISSNIKKRGDLATYSAPFEPNGNEARSLVKIIQKLQQENIHVILFTTPIYKELYYSADSCQMKNYEDFLQKISRDHGIPVYYLHDKYLKLDIWRDQTHIIWGRSDYTEDVAKIILKEI